MGRTRKKKKSMQTKNISNFLSEKENYGHF